MTGIGEAAAVHVVDDDDAMRDALCVLLRSVRIPAVPYRDGEAFLREAGPKMRGCVVLDVRMPGRSGFEVGEQMRHRGIHLPTILISAHGNIRQAVKAMHAGAFDFIEKPFDDQELLDRIHRALAHSEEIERHDRWLSRAKSQFESLTDREKTVFKLIADGLFNKEIAGELGISTRTVENHRARVMRKLGANGVPDLVKIAIGLGVSEQVPS